jgi:hypothetical protein
MSALLAIVQALLTPNLRHDLPFLIMLLMLQGIHPEIIFELIPYVTISRQQHEAIMMAWTLLREFSSILPGVRGVKPRTFLQQMILYGRVPQDRISLIFGNFQNSVLSRMLTQCGFAGPLPSFEIVRRLGLDLAVFQSVHSSLFPIKRLFLISHQRLVLMKTALQMQEMIEHIRLFSPDIVSFLAQKNNAMNNIIIIWNNQVIVQQHLYGQLVHYQKDVKMNQLFAFLILAVVDPNFINGSLAQIIANCGNRNVPFPNIQKHSQFLKVHCQSIAPMIFGHFLDIGQVLDCFSSMLTFSGRSFQVRYALRQWSMAFGRIVPFGHHEFEEVTIEQESWVPIFDVFSRFWDVFFRNFSRTFEVSFLPFGNIPWSEGYTRLIQTNFDWIIRIVVGNFAFRIGAKDDHAFFKSQTPEYMHTDITPPSYGMYIFPDNIRNCEMTSKICSCFLRDFLRAHQKPDANMSDIDYIRWLFSIPGTFKVFGESWIELVDALQNGTELPRVQDGSSGDFRYLSCPIDETDPDVQSEYDVNFRQKLGRDPEIGDYMGGERQFPPYPPMRGEARFPPYPPHAL